MVGTCSGSTGKNERVDMHKKFVVNPRRGIKSINDMKANEFNTVRVTKLAEARVRGEIDPR